MTLPAGRGFAVLLDTNAILEAHRAGCWKALVGQYRVETVERCVIEVLTGHQNRKASQNIDQQELRRRLHKEHAVYDTDRANLQVRFGLPAMDDGERDLWAHAVTRFDSWVLCGPDAASMRFGKLAGFGEKLVSLEELLLNIGHKPMPRLRDNYTRRWLEAQMVRYMSLP